NWTGTTRSDGSAGRNPAAPENASTTLFPPGIPLVAGQAYYFEARHKESVSGDSLDVTWQTPATGPSPGLPVNSSTGDASLGNGGTKSIPGRYLARFVSPRSDTTS